MRYTQVVVRVWNSVCANGMEVEAVAISTWVLQITGRGRWAVGTGTCITRQGLAAGAWSDRIRQMKSRRVADPIRAMGEDTMWITASSAVGLVLSLAAVAALGGYLLSMGVDNAELSEEEKIESLKQQGLYEKPEPTQYEEQGVVTRTRKRRSSKD
ncbi:uncharacterized protein [Physcomitrium patens]|uniref:Uncharacterized protein n=2 Tax=Physcomitrium patens TaxID=3218 RepID=A0A7I4DPM9_PHYPA|nr:uncharacterized protein LOC112282585 isoform X4 [Physcomitrium patens]XP_024376138.1 uncharacterized protein LOC112282585 isoform X4 [Physcomitrium patens]|eukprot:XP_024376137.1 uncharacterized protein LOC112282585 isoform X4 [Physcomitrella patens]